MDLLRALIFFSSDKGDKDEISLFLFIGRWTLQIELGKVDNLH